MNVTFQVLPQLSKCFYALHEMDKFDKLGEKRQMSQAYVENPTLSLLGAPSCVDVIVPLQVFVAATLEASSLLQCILLSPPAVTVQRS